MDLIAWDEETGTAILPERPPVDLEWARFPSGAKKQYAVPVKIDLGPQETAWQESELLRTDSMLQPDRPNATEIVAYRQALRDYNNHADFPNGTRPSL